MRKLMGKIKIGIRSLRWTIIAAAALIFLGGIAVGWHFGFAVALKNQAPDTQSQGYIRESGYKLIAPLLVCDTNSSKEVVEFAPIQNKIETDIFDSLNNSSVDTVSVYFRDLTTGRWMGINENIAYDPAILLKVPIMIAAYKEAESDPNYLQEKILYQAGTETDFITLPVNQYYTVQQLINAMIVNSDNVAKDLIIESINQDSLHEIYSDLGIPFFGDPNNIQYQISAKTYAFFFRVLYNATYLNKDDSEKALELLSQASFMNGLVGGVPSSTIVAHKYGTYAQRDASGNAILGEIHDCGVVYEPDHPYLLCVMTKGSAKAATFEAMIQNVSHIVYQEVGNKYQ